MRKFSLSAVAVSLLMVSAGCSKQAFSTVEGELERASKVPTQPTSPRYCELDATDYDLSTEVMSFQLKDKGGVSFGFLVGGLLKALGVTIRLESGQMDVAMNLVEPLSPQYPLVDVTGQGYSSGREFSLDLDVVKLQASIDYYYQTPLATLSNKALQNTFAKVVNDLSAIETPWKTRVTNVLESNQVIVPVGTVAGLQEGDEFAIYNVEHVWKGEPCASEYRFSSKTTAPVATGKVTQLEMNAARLDLETLSEDAAVLPGAYVEIKKLVSDSGNKGPQRTLARSIRISSLTSQKLRIQDKGDVEIVKYMNKQLREVIAAKNFYLRQ